MTRDQILARIWAERDRQAEIWADEHEWGKGDCSSSGVPHIVKSVVLAEECGEVAMAVLQMNAAALEDELVQVAAVAIAWLESM